MVKIERNTSSFNVLVRSSSVPRRSVGFVFSSCDRVLNSGLNFLA